MALAQGNSQTDTGASQAVDITKDEGGYLTAIKDAIEGEVEAVQPIHDDLNANANIQVGNSDAGPGNPVPSELTSAENATLTIANGAALSDELDFTDKTKLIIHMPAAWTAAEIGFKVASATGGTFNVLYDENGMRVEAEADADYVISIPSEYLAGCPYLKLWSQTAGANVNQGAERSITVSMI